MATLRETCRGCGEPIDVFVGQAVPDRQLRWSKSYSCPFCGGMQEEDGSGPAPDNVRNAILLEEGEWNLVLSEKGTRLLMALMLLRETLGLSLQGAEQLKKRVPGPIANGTRAEMAWLRAILKTKGLAAAVEKSSA